MRKSILLIMTVIILINSIFLVGIQTVHAESSVFSRDKVISIAKGIGALILINQLHRMINQTSSREAIAEQSRDRGVDLDSLDRNVKLDASSLNGQVIVIDPGHGGHDPGAIGPGGLKEKDVNLDIALRLYRIIKENTAAQVYLTRDSDQFIPLDNRADLANKVNSHVFISIHCNADEKGLQSGIETYAHYNTSSDSWALAWYIQQGLVEELGLIDRGLKADGFKVIKETASMKSILLEIGFISNNREENLLRESSIRERVAQAIFRGMVGFFSKS